MTNPSLFNPIQKVEVQDEKGNLVFPRSGFGFFPHG